MANNLNWEILKSFSNDEHECFTYSDVINKFPEIDSLYVSKVLSSMVRKGMLIKLKHNLYNTVPTNATLNYPYGLEIANDDTMYISDSKNNSIRKIKNNTITSFYNTTETLADMVIDTNNNFLYIFKNICKK